MAKQKARGKSKSKPAEFMVYNRFTRPRKGKKSEEALGAEVIAKGWLTPLKSSSGHPALCCDFSDYPIFSGANNMLMKLGGNFQEIEPFIPHVIKDKHFKDFPNNRASLLINLYNAELQATYAIAETNKEFKNLSKTDVNIIYNKPKNVLVSTNFDEPTVIAINKSGKHITHKHFGSTMKLFANDANNTIDNSTTASKGQAQNIKAFEKRILALETKIKSLKAGPKGEKGDTGIQGLPGERGPKGDSGSSSVDTDIITGINSKISSLEKAVELDQKLPSSSSNNNNINYYLNRNYEDTQSIFTELSGIYGRLAASEMSISSTYNTDSNLDLLSLITALTSRVEALEV
jgi:hypothetical protein